MSSYSVKMIRRRGDQAAPGCGVGLPGSRMPGQQFGAQPVNQPGDASIRTVAVLLGERAISPRSWRSRAALAEADAPDHGGGGLLDGGRRF